LASSSCRRDVQGRGGSSCTGPPLSWALAKSLLLIPSLPRVPARVLLLLPLLQEVCIAQERPVCPPRPRPQCAEPEPMGEGGQGGGAGGKHGEHGGRASTSVRLWSCPPTEKERSPSKRSLVLWTSRRPYPPSPAGNATASPLPGGWLLLLAASTRAMSSASMASRNCLASEDADRARASTGPSGSMSLAKRGKRRKLLEDVLYNRLERTQPALTYTSMTAH